MPTITIDNRPVDVPEGATVLDAARKLGIDVPALCYREGCEANTSCMACVVRVDGRANLVPSCATKAVEGMRVESEADDIRAVRRTALELLLSDHLGDCLAPCHTVCPATMNIPLMIRQIAAGRMREAIATVKADIALPAVLGRICPAPCEKACRRGSRDAPVAICLLKRYAADVDLASGDPYLPDRAGPSGKSVAIVGAGPTGLAAAYYLLQAGHACTVFDDRPAPGGMLRYGVPEAELDRGVLDAEIEIVRRLGAELRSGTRVGEAVSMDELRRGFDAVFVAAGQIDEAQAAALALEWTAAGARADRRTFQTPTPEVFASVSPRQQKMAVRAVAAGKAAAASIGQFLAGRAVPGEKRPFSVHVGRLKEGEIDRFMEGISDAARVAPADPAAGFAQAEAVAEGLRCLHCDCRRPHDCLLRKYADAYDAEASKYKAERQTFRQVLQHAEVIFEPGKCIKCGLCVQITARAGERLGLTFVGRGFRAHVAVPLDHSLAEGLEKAAADCVAACPTAALAFRDKP
ncbi:MAG TPA: FAD-dependent oxidoreductase [Phycisphaerae bacterium]|nr:FAD-dependent oxidoreductase [Phycisphaerae bacterium]